MQYLLRPRATLGLRRAQLEYRTAILVEGITSRAFPAAKVSRSIQVTHAVEDQITPRNIALLGGRKAVQDGVSPLAALGLRRGQLKHRAASALDAQEHAVSGSTVGRGSVDVSRCIRDHAARGKLAIVVLLTSKHMEHSLGPRISLLGWRSELVDRAAGCHGRTVTPTTLLRSSIEIALLVKHHATCRCGPVGAALEAVKDFLFPLCRGVACERRKEQHNYEQSGNRSARPSVVWDHLAHSSSKPARTAGKRTTFALPIIHPIALTAVRSGKTLDYL